ncbi:MAG TPA: hypothetical protein VN706_05160 [Gemmatimonadaceae bacterium]|nr:hypothetical protein [Gemmatimonadaceae bacterium]
MRTNALCRAAALCCLIVPLSAAVGTAQAQGVIVARPAAGAMVGAARINRELPVGDDVIGAIIGKYEPQLLTDESEANHLTIVLDNLGNYVKSTVRPVTMLRAAEGDSGTVAVAAANAVMVRRIASDEVQPAGAVVASFARSSDSAAVAGFMGTGVQMSDVDGIAMKRYDAGALTKGALIVTVVKLK